MERFINLGLLFFIMDDCVFCKIVAEIKEEDVIWEDENHVALLDINPCARGHVMVIPKEHSRWVWDIEDDKYSDYMLAVKKVAGILRNAFGTDCVQSAIVGMDVSHAHVHLLPRVEGDGFKGIPVTPIEPKPTAEEMKEIFDKIRAVV